MMMMITPTVMPMNENGDDDVEDEDDNDDNVDDEDDYEDRVDEWIESGVSKMKIMNETIQDEVKPGAVTYPGGLNIPSWINDRLFGYQRIGLRWLWELHQQSAGGIGMHLFFTVLFLKPI